MRHSNERFIIVVVVVVVVVVFRCCFYLLFAVIGDVVHVILAVGVVDNEDVAALR